VSIYLKKSERSLIAIAEYLQRGEPHMFDPMRKRVDVSIQAYSASRVNQELAKEGIPLPFGNRLWATNWPTQNAPFPGLVVHLISTVSNYVLVSQFMSFFIEVIVIIAPPLSVAYPFILDVASYPAQIVNLFVILVRVFPLLSSSPQLLLTIFEQGLFYLRWKKPHLPRPFKGTPIQLHSDFASLLISDNVVWLPLAIFFLLVEAFCMSSHALFERHEEKLTYLSPSDNLPVSAPRQWGR
jgi:hypothetical protein